MMQFDRPHAQTSRLRLDRRNCLCGIAALIAGFARTGPAHAAAFAQWVEEFRSRARGRGISDATYDRAMKDLKPDTSVYALDSAQPEFNEELWQYLNRRVSDWRINVGRQRAKDNAKLLAKVEHDTGVDRFIMLGLWGMESAFGDVIDDPKYMRPIFPALAALAWGEPRRRSYWEQELLNALVIVERGWAKPEEMIGSWAGAMGHTQWMPEVWLHMGVDYDHDGRISPFGHPDDALAGTARYLNERGKYGRGEAWGCEARLPDGFNGKLADRRTWRTYGKWHALGVGRADGKPFGHAHHRARLWLPETGGPAFLLGPNFYAVRSYNPSYAYTLAVVLLGDRIRGDGPLRQ
jgi:lytic murein transglycosylase